MDPYVVIQYKGVNHKTKVAKSGGKAPKWTDEFTLKVGNTSDEMKISIYDEDVTSDDFVSSIKKRKGPIRKIFFRSDS
jgi:Ca2+-dependent lipid-binding protein